MIGNHTIVSDKHVQLNNNLTHMISRYEKRVGYNIPMCHLKALYLLLNIYGNNNMTYYIVDGVVHLLYYSVCVELLNKLGYEWEWKYQLWLKYE